MDKYSNPDVFIVLVGFIGIILLGALLGEVAVWIAKILGYEFIDDQVNVDFMQRLQDGEVLDAENMFSDGK
tara:strand:- start:447 stop:659 length:213 start_codon:yes stop_codon:yes gene_type:complete